MFYVYVGYKKSIQFNVPSCQTVLRNLVYRFTMYVWIGVQTSYYVPLAAVISYITYELGRTGCRLYMCIFVRFLYLTLLVSYYGLLYCAQQMYRCV